jgi:hypothetical protein
MGGMNDDYFVSMTIADLLRRHPDWSITFQAETKLDTAVILRVRSDKLPDAGPIAVLTKRVVPFEGAFVDRLLETMEADLSDIISTSQSRVVA